MLNVLLVDDEPLAHEVLLHHCRAHPDLRVVGQCHNAAEALAKISEVPVDLMFLDVRMPRFGGLDLLRGLEAPPLAIIVSAHREHALDGFELDVVDYLLKPVSSDRFAAALEKARRRLAEQKQDTPSEQEYLALRVDGATRRLRLDRISGFQAEGNFVKVWSDEGNCLATTTLRKLLETLPEKDFVQVHRSFVVRRDRIFEQRRASVTLDNGMEVPIGRSYRKREVI
ncbi:MAG: hypothetical protein APF78_01590 [Sphingomonadales bacterium BRH_c3]|nr:MAG: hypothetical protein APF78_01590 [Sphingomonadales bacterium BRH_c3]